MPSGIITHCTQPSLVGLPTEPSQHRPGVPGKVACGSCQARRGQQQVPGLGESRPLLFSLGSSCTVKGAGSRARRCEGNPAGTCSPRYFQILQGHNSALGQVSSSAQDRRYALGFLPAPKLREGKRAMLVPCFGSPQALEKVIFPAPSTHSTLVLPGALPGHRDSGSQ